MQEFHILIFLVLNNSRSTGAAIVLFNIKSTLELNA